MAPYATRESERALRPGEEAVDVIVVGGGPTGIMTALLLADRGLSVRVLERSDEVYDLPRAVHMDDETQRVFQGIGLDEGLRSITTPVPGAEFVDAEGTRIMGVEHPTRDDWLYGHHPSVMYDQPELEAFMRRAALAAGVDLRLGEPVIGVDQDDVSVVARTERGDHVASWLIAADGASSSIRKQLGIPFVDQGFDQDWLVIDVRLRQSVETLPEFVQQICDPMRPTTYVVGHGRARRWEFQLQPGERAEEMTDPDRAWRLLSPWLTRDDAEIVRSVVYRFHATVAERMRIGRVFLAGDAAHQMPPFLGQGLCSGIRDAANLAWKLGLVTRGVASYRLLDTYGDERLRHAAATVAHAVDTGRLIDQLAGRRSHGVALDAAYGGDRPDPHLDSGLRWGGHDATGRQVPQPTVAGEPLDARLGDGFAIVVARPSTAEPALREWGDLATVVEVPHDLLPGVLPSGGAVVVRPDRYVAAVAEDAEELVEASRALMGIVR